MRKKKKTIQQYITRTDTYIPTTDRFNVLSVVAITHLTAIIFLFINYIMVWFLNVAIVTFEGE